MRENRKTARKAGGLTCQWGFPYGWDNSVYAGARGLWAAKDEAENTQYLIDWLEHCEQTAGLQDSAGNRYYVVDSYVLKQAIETLRKYKGLLAENFGEQIGSVRGDGCEAEQGIQGVI